MTSKTKLIDEFFQKVPPEAFVDKLQEIAIREQLYATFSGDFRNGSIAGLMASLELISEYLSPEIENSINSNTECGQPPDA